MPAENSMAIHEPVENSGASSSVPRGILPFDEYPTISMNANTVIVRIVKNHPVFNDTQ